MSGWFEIKSPHSPSECTCWQPRIITTRDELDALPEGSLILDSDPDVLVKRKGRWRSPDYPDDSFGPASIGLPATVLHEPEPQP